MQALIDNGHFSDENETKLTFTPANATTNRLTMGCYLYFTCITTGTWHFAFDLARDPLAVNWHICLGSVINKIM